MPSDVRMDIAIDSRVPGFCPLGSLAILQVQGVLEGNGLMNVGMILMKNEIFRVK